MQSAARRRRSQPPPVPGRQGTARPGRSFSLNRPLFCRKNLNHLYGGAQTRAEPPNTSGGQFKLNLTQTLTRLFWDLLNTRTAPAGQALPQIALQPPHPHPALSSDVQVDAEELSPLHHPSTPRSRAAVPPSTTTPQELVTTRARSVPLRYAEADSGPTEQARRGSRPQRWKGRSKRLLDGI